ncbi:hypothetical protein EDC96DRAFT_545532 [Choanephora cucurbitarum]|nr:hypothetical protein EDC96DRAFT_545532 [Choanephora cucurbitarum]
MTSTLQTSLTIVMTPDGKIPTRLMTNLKQRRSEIWYEEYFEVNEKLSQIDSRHKHKKLFSFRTAQLNAVKIDTANNRKVTSQTEAHSKTTDKQTNRTHSKTTERAHSRQIDRESTQQTGRAHSKKTHRQEAASKEHTDKDQQATKTAQRQRKQQVKTTTDRETTTEQKETPNERDLISARKQEAAST